MTNQWKELTSKFAGRCKHPECKNDFKVGEQVLWRRSFGTICLKHKASPTQTKLTKTNLPVAGGQLPVRIAYGWKEVDRPKPLAKSREERRQEPIPARVK